MHLLATPHSFPIVTPCCSTSAFNPLGGFPSSELWSCLLRAFDHHLPGLGRVRAKHTTTTEHSIVFSSTAIRSIDTIDCAKHSQRRPPRNDRLQQAKGGGLDFSDGESQEFTWDEAMAGAAALRVRGTYALRLQSWGFRYRRQGRYILYRGTTGC